MSWHSSIGAFLGAVGPCTPRSLHSHVDCAEQGLKTTLSRVGQAAAPRHQHTRKLAALLESQQKAEAGVSMLGPPLISLSL